MSLDDHSYVFTGMIQLSDGGMMKGYELVDAIIKKTGMDRLSEEKTCDKLMTGSWDSEVTGIATTFMATVEVIRKCIDLGINFIITHEPTWFTGHDTTRWLEGDPVYLEKLKLINEHNITIWRFHDHMHMGIEDVIYTGVIKDLGLESFRMRGEKHGFIIPKTTLGDLCAALKDNLRMKTLRIVGDKDMPIERVGILVGGGSLGLGTEQMPMEFMRKLNLDVVICGDIIEWTLTPYVRDAKSLGFNRSLIIVGHERSEEPGMKHLHSWLAPITKDIPVYFVDAREPFSYV